jgi:hypothetical protein
MTGAWTRTFLTSAFLFAASSSAQTLEFEVAAIKPAAPQAVHVGTNIDGTRLDTGFFSLTALIVTAYKVEAYQIKGPDWMATTRFDIQKLGLRLDKRKMALDRLVVEHIEKTPAEN